MGRETSTERHRHSHKHSKHSKHKHKHKHGRHHHSSKHKKKRSRSDRERKRDDTPEVQVNERDLQAALEKLDEAIIEVGRVYIYTSLVILTILLHLYVAMCAI